MVKLNGAMQWFDDTLTRLTGRYRDLSDDNGCSIEGDESPQGEENETAPLIQQPSGGEVGNVSTHVLVWCGYLHKFSGIGIWLVCSVDPSLTSKLNWANYMLIVGLGKKKGSNIPLCSCGAVKCCP